MGSTRSRRTSRSGADRYCDTKSEFGVVSQWGEREDPLAKGHGGHDAIGDIGGLVTHPPRAAARAEAALFAREGDEDVVAARVAVAPDEALGEIAAREVALEGVDHVARQRRGVGGFGVGDEGRVMLADEAVEDGLVRAARRVRGGDAGHARPFAGGVPTRFEGISRGNSARGHGGAQLHHLGRRTSR